MPEFSGSRRCVQPCSKKEASRHRAISAAFPSRTVQPYIPAPRGEDLLRVNRETQPSVEAWTLGCGGRREAGVS